VYETDDKQVITSESNESSSKALFEALNKIKFNYSKNK